MPHLHPNILATIGDTPVVRLNALAPTHAALYAKLEAFNPMGSVKDRLALAVIEAAERDGSLRPGQTVVEATSGNTGIGLAMVCAVKGYPLVACEPDNAPILLSGIAQARAADGSPAASHPMFRPHLMQGWTPDFIPKLTQDALDAGHVDRIVGVNGADAMAGARDLARREGIFCGLSGGATYAAARAVADEMPGGGVVLFIVPDTGERYLSTPLFADIPEEMTDAEQEIAASTDGYRIGGPSRPAAAPTAATAPDPEAVAWFETAVGDPGTPVVLFALE